MVELVILMLPPPPYRPNDVIVMRRLGDGGYVVGHVLPSDTVGSWWEHLETLGTLEGARETARRFAARFASRAWIINSTYTEIPASEAAAT